MILVLREKGHLLHLACTRLDYDVLFVVDDGLKLLGRNAEKGGNLVRSRLEIPDVSYRHGEADVSHPLTTHLLLGHLDITPVADDTTVTDSLVLAAIALVVLGRTEDLLAEQTVLLRLVCPVVDGFRLEDLATRAVGDIFRRCKSDADRLEVALYLVVFVIVSWHFSFRSNN